VWLSIVLCLVGRAANIFSLAPIANRFRKTKIPFKNMVAQWHAGIRGAIAYAIAIGFPSHQRGKIISTTSFVILFSVFILGGSTVPMLEALKVGGRAGGWTGGGRLQVWAGVGGGRTGGGMARGAWRAV
jgi:sodium/hydrogen exchanger 8